MIPLLSGAVLFTLLTVLAAALGRRILILLKVSPVDRLEHGVFAIGLGLGALQLIPFCLFAMGYGKPVAIRVTTALLAILLAPDLFQVIRAVGREFGALKQLPLWQKILTAVFTVLFACLFLRAVCPPTDGDALSYHLTAGFRYLQAGEFAFLPTLVHTNWPLGVEMLFAWLVGLTPSAPAAIAHFALGIVAVLSCYLLGRRLSGPFAGAAAIVLLLLYRGFWGEMVLAYIDLGMAAFATLAVLALVASAQDSERSARWRTLSALLAGLAATTKLNGVWVILSIAIVIALGSSVTNENPRQRILAALKFAGIGGFVVLPWFLRTWALTGNPLYPAFYSIFGGREWTTAGYSRLHEFYLRLNTPPGMPPTPTVLWWSHAAVSAIGIVLAFSVLLATRRSPTAIPARFAALFTAFVCTFSIFNLRFLMAAIPALAVCLAAPLSGLERRWTPLLCVVAVLLAIPLGITGVEPNLPTATRVGLGMTSHEEYQSRHVLDHPLVKYANTLLPEESRILISELATNTALYRPLTLNADYWTQDSVHYDSAERMEADLRRLGVTHVVIQTKYPDWCDRSATCSRRLNPEQIMLLRFVRDNGELLVGTDSVALYRLND